MKFNFLSVVTSQLSLTCVHVVVIQDLFFYCRLLNSPELGLGNGQIVSKQARLVCCSIRLLVCSGNIALFPGLCLIWLHEEQSQGLVSKVTCTDQEQKGSRKVLIECTCRQAQLQFSDSE